MRLNMQYFAEQTTEQEPKKDESTFTQADIDNAVAKAKEGLPTDDELTAYRQWKLGQDKPQESDTQTNAELEALKQEKQNVEKELLSYKQRDKVIESGVNPKFAKFVAFEVNGQGGDFDKALTAYLEANPEYKQSLTPGKTGMKQGGSVTQADGVETAFLKRNPNLKLD